MEQVYSAKLWGDNGTDFYSGHGSHEPQLVAPYIAAVTTFLQSLKPAPTICDLGCGDFNIGSQLVPFCKKYIGVDIVEDLVAFNTRAFTSPNLEFVCADIAKDPLPKGDCAIVRQVLQHLSNAEIQAVANKLYHYRYVVLTEHLPLGDYVPNVDIISGQGIRLKHQSGIDLLQAPFDLRVKEATVLLVQNPIVFEGQLVTTVFRMF